MHGILKVINVGQGDCMIISMADYENEDRLLNLPLYAIEAIRSYRHPESLRLKQMRYPYG